MAKNNKMTAKQFALWMEEQAGARCRLVPGRAECVIDIGHIEPGRFAALYAIDSSTGLLVVELADNFASESEAWKAIETESSLAFPPRFFDEWVQEQYLADKSAQVEQLSL
ncbi:MAG TPA: hypothetical protein VN426_06010 [Syntrophomonadaceae bacterium]|nr:hypothetical protein [Syntrophomonadaceae bacterium]